jgi:hypothetical protein
MFEPEEQPTSAGQPEQEEGTILQRYLSQLGMPVGTGLPQVSGLPSNDTPVSLRLPRYYGAPPDHPPTNSSTVDSPHGVDLAEAMARVRPLPERVGNRAQVSPSSFVGHDFTTSSQPVQPATSSLTTTPIHDFHNSPGQTDRSSYLARGADRFFREDQHGRSVSGNDLWSRPGESGTTGPEKPTPREAAVMQPPPQANRDGQNVIGASLPPSVSLGEKSLSGFTGTPQNSDSTLRSMTEASAGGMLPTDTPADSLSATTRETTSAMRAKAANGGPVLGDRQNQANTMASGDLAADASMQPLNTSVEEAGGATTAAEAAGLSTEQKPQKRDGQPQPAPIDPNNPALGKTKLTQDYYNLVHSPAWSRILPEYKKNLGDVLGQGYPKEANDYAIFVNKTILGNTVGRGGMNDPADVRIVQQLLNAAVTDDKYTDRFKEMGAYKKLLVDGKVSDQMLKMIDTYQRIHSLIQPATPAKLRLINTNSGTMQQLAKNRLADPRWNIYDETIRQDVDAYNRKMAQKYGKNRIPFQPLDWRLVKAMLWTEVEGPDTKEAKWWTRPMQIGNPQINSRTGKKDPAMDVVKSGKLWFVPPDLLESLKHSELGQSNVRAGIAYLYDRAMSIKKKFIDGTPDGPYTVISGDNLERIAEKLHTTVQDLYDNNPRLKKNKGRSLKPGDQLTYVYSHTEPTWNWDAAMPKYNSQTTTSDNAKKVKANYARIIESGQ